jgi:hypothetical protein
MVSLLPGVELSVHIDRRLWGPHGQSGRWQKKQISCPDAIWIPNPRPTNPVTGRFTGWAIPTSMRVGRLHYFDRFLPAQKWRGRRQCVMPYWTVTGAESDGKILTDQQASNTWPCLMHFHEPGHLSLNSLYESVVCQNTFRAQDNATAHTRDHCINVLFLFVVYSMRLSLSALCSTPQ